MNTDDGRADDGVRETTDRTRQRDVLRQVVHARVALVRVTFYSAASCFKKKGLLRCAAPSIKLVAFFIAGFVFFFTAGCLLLVGVSPSSVRVVFLGACRLLGSVRFGSPRVCPMKHAWNPHQRD